MHHANLACPSVNFEKAYWCLQSLKKVADAALPLQLMPETLYLTCNIIDRYLAQRNVTRKRLQLVSLSACNVQSIHVSSSVLVLPVCGCSAEEISVLFAGGSNCHAHCLQV
jgi:hypothetical protein